MDTPYNPTASSGGPVSPVGARRLNTPLPPKLQELQDFLRGASKMGSELAFWRGQARLRLLREASEELRVILSHPRVFEGKSSPGNPLRSAFEDLLSPVESLVDAVPFRTKVGVLRKSLIPCYQELFVLRSLLQSAICRIRAQAGSTGAAPAGGLLHVSARLQFRSVAGQVAPLWDQEEWNLYDYL